MAKQVTWGELPEKEQRALKEVQGPTPITLNFIKPQDDLDGKEWMQNITYDLRIKKDILNVD